MDQTTILHTDIGKPSAEALKLTYSQKIAVVIGNKYSEYVLTGLITLYSCIVIVRIAFDTDLDSANYSLNVTELVILSLFALETILKILVLKKEYFRSWINDLDLGIIITCFIVIILDISNSSATNSSAYKLAKVLRIFRLLLMFRKASDLRVKHERRSIRNYSVVSVTTPSETVLMILNKVLDYEWVALNNPLRKEICWCIEMIKSRKLFDVNVIADSFADNEIAKMGMNEEEYRDVNENFSIISSVLPMATFDQSINSYLQYCAEWDFDIFRLEKETLACGLEVLTGHLFTIYNLYNALEIPQQTFNSFIHEVALGYLKENPYHNSTHAADVVQAFYYFLNTCEAKSICRLHDLEIAVCLISAAVHDYQHPGFNNLFLVNSGDFLAIRYNDKSVLENHHLAAFFSLLKDENKDIFQNFSRDLYKKVRGKIINIVLATDFSRHFSDISRFQTKLNSGVVDDEESRGLCMEMMMHAADISNPTRTWEICSIWADRVMSEFFAQGDKERDLCLPISQLCDRYTVNIAKSQVGFMDLFIEPTFTALLIVLPKAELNLQMLRQNKKLWNELKE